MLTSIVTKFRVNSAATDKLFIGPRFHSRYKQLNGETTEQPKKDIIPLTLIICKVFRNRTADTASSSTIIKPHKIKFSLVLS